MRILVSVVAIGVVLSAPVGAQGMKEGDKHSQRHILQIREIKAHASYPRTRK